MSWPTIISTINAINLAVIAFVLFKRRNMPVYRPANYLVNNTLSVKNDTDGTLYIERADHTRPGGPSGWIKIVSLDGRDVDIPELSNP